MAGGCDYGAKWNRSAPQLLMMGDSISLGMHAKLSLLLEPGIQVTHIPVNSLFPQTGLRCVEDWLGPSPGRWDYVTMGPWHGIGNCTATIRPAECDSFPPDPAIDPWPAHYVAQLFNLTRRIRTHNAQAKLLLLAQTPVCSNHACCDDTLPEGGHCNSVISRYNAETCAALQPLGVTYVDLFGVVNRRCGAGFAECDISLCNATQCNVHFNADGWAMLAEVVARAVVPSSTHPAPRRLGAGPGSPGWLGVYHAAHGATASGLCSLK